MTALYLTVDVEVWCEDWDRLDEQFPEAFRRYVYGPTPQGDFGLPYQLALLKQHGLRACFFVEPLFSLRFGKQWLREIVSLILEDGQEVQLHLHPEWVDEIDPPPVPIDAGKRPLMRQYSLSDQTRLIALGKHLLEEAGVERVSAFRAGSFGFNSDTLIALRRNGITIDASYNATMYGPDSGVGSGGFGAVPFDVDGVLEVPMSVYRDGIGGRRHVQLGASTWPELERLLWQAAEAEAGALTILTHNFELLNQARNAPDPVVIKRMVRLCEFLAAHRDRFATPLLAHASLEQWGAESSLAVSPWMGLRRAAEQFSRRRYG